MKKLFIIVMILLIFLSGCKEKRLSNIIEKRNLSNEDKKILKIEKNYENSSIFNYKFDNIYKSVEIWLEVYKKGKLLNERNKAFSKIKGNKSKIFIGVDYDEKYSWMISHQNTRDVMKYSFITNDDFLKENTLKRNIYTLKKEKNIENKDILLKSYLFSEENNSLSKNDLKEDNLERFNYAYLIKIRFNK